MRRLVPLAVLAIACTSTSAEVQDTDVVEVSPALGTPPPVPRHGWVRVEGVVESTRITERGASRADDKLAEAAMEDRKREGYF